ncbi:hypothetical protein [Actinoplanes sp. NPDC049681]|uniref:hypothetical protein n=1 Tax=Actinoplanes sp. NPDC049681 TaxID=3363905 RepID=UPI00379A399F
MGEDLALEQAKSQYVHVLGCDITTMRSETIAEQLRQRGITIVCTAVSITLDIGTVSADVTPELKEPAPVEPLSQGTIQLTIPLPRGPMRNPHRSHPKRE